MDDFIVRSLTREYRISTASREVAHYVEFFAAKPEIEGPALARIDISVEPATEGFRIHSPDGTETEASAVQAANHLHQLVFGGLNEEAPAAPLVHGASLVCDGRRILLIGRRGSGKSTLTLHLLAAGFDVEGDEHVVVREEDLIARPRRMRIKQGSLGLVPQLADRIGGSPSLPDESGSPVYAVDPSIGGRPWRIRPGRAHHLIFIEPHHGGTSSLSALSHQEAFQWLAADCLLPASSKAAALGRLRKLALSADTWQLRLGDLGQAEACLERCVAERSHPSPG